MSRNLILAFWVLGAAFSALFGETLPFGRRPLLAGKASLTSPGFEVTRTLGEVALYSEEDAPRVSYERKGLPWKLFR